MDFTDLWRVGNALLALVAAIMIGRNMIIKWNVRQPRMRLMSMSLLSLLIVVVEGSLEQISLHTPTGPRTVLTTAACIWVVVALFATPDDYTEVEGEEQ